MTMRVTIMMVMSDKNQDKEDTEEENKNEQNVGGLHV